MHVTNKNNNLKMLVLEISWIVLSTLIYNSEE